LPRHAAPYSAPERECKTKPNTEVIVPPSFLSSLHGASISMVCSAMQRFATPRGDVQNEPKTWALSVNPARVNGFAGHGLVLDVSPWR
jgi:hypothetical protein